MAEVKNNIQFSTLLADILEKPGRISEAYSAFHNYSLGNMLAAASQLEARGIPLGPIASFMAWKDKGRSVKKGAKAIALCMPITGKGEKKDAETFTYSRFVWKNNWFVLSETEGQDFACEAKTPEWSPEKALQTLDVLQVPFEAVNGNCQGYAFARNIAINPLAAMPHKTRFHELAHIVLGHTSESRMQDDEHTPKDIREVEAESVAYILCALLDLPGLTECRGYVKSWLGTQTISEKSAQRICKAADTIYKAGANIAITL